MRTVLAVLALLLVAGCGTQTGPGPFRATEPTGPGERPTAVPAADGPVQTRTPVTVMDTGRPELCLGGVAESYPPQCGGPPITHWSWTDHAGAFEEVQGVRWGEFHVVGSFDGERFTASRVTPAAEYAAPSRPEDDVDLGTPCEDVDVADPARTSREDLEAASGAAQRLDGYGRTWLDTSRDPRTPEEMDQDAAAGHEDVSTWVLNVGVTGDPAAAEAQLRELWGGGLCVSRVPYTQAELSRIQEQLGDLPGFTSSGTEADHVSVGVVHDDGSLQAWVDQEYGEGVVEVWSALVPAP